MYLGFPVLSCQARVGTSLSDCVLAIKLRGLFFKALFTRLSEVLHPLLV